MSRQVRIRLKSAKMSHQETEEKIKRLLSRMEELQNSQKRIFDELSEHQSKIFEDILEKLVLHFKSEGTISSFCDWTGRRNPQTPWDMAGNKERGVKVRLRENTPICSALGKRRERIRQSSSVIDPTLLQKV